MKKIEIIDLFVSIFSVIAVVVILLYGYFALFVKNITIGINNIGDQLGLDVVAEKDLSEDDKVKYAERWFLEANYYSNSRKNGVELRELNLNYFRGFELTSNLYRSSGMQAVGEINWVTEYVSSDKEANDHLSGGFCYYTSSDGISFDGGLTNTQLNRNEQFIIKIDDKPYVIQMTGKEEHKVFLWFKDIIYYTYGTLFKSVMEAIETNSAGYGDYYITLDLSKFFTIREYDPETKQFKKDNVTDIIKDYAVLKFHYDENGAKTASQSMFKRINLDAMYDTTEKVDTSYWQARVTYNFNVDSTFNGKPIFDYRYSEIYKGYFLSLNLDMRDELSKMPRTKIIVNIDLNSKYLRDNEINIIGLDESAFEGIVLDTLIIKGAAQDFTMRGNCLKDTKLQQLKLSEGIELLKLSDFINSEYVEVVI